MPPRGRLGIRAPSDLASGFTDDRSTDKGNQDRLAIAYCLDPAQTGDQWFFAGVCDGVGGEAEGDVAASLALSEIIAHLCMGAAEPPARRLESAIRRAHSEVQKRLFKRSATTFVGVFITSRGDLIVGSVGDSRAYSIAQQKVDKLTQDDTLAEMLRRQMPNSSNEDVLNAIQALEPRWRESLGQAIGSDLTLYPGISVWPNLPRDSGFLLCTDGVWKVADPVLKAAASASPGLSDLARRLLSLSENLGATDNATAIVIPNFSQVVNWLRDANANHEIGLVHVVLPGETAVVPWALFDQSPYLLPERVNAERAPNKVKEWWKHEPAEKPKQKAKTTRTTKSKKTAKAEGLQMTITEEPKDDDPGTTVFKE